MESKVHNVTQVKSLHVSRSIQSLDGVSQRCGLEGLTMSSKSEVGVLEADRSSGITALNEALTQEVPDRLDTGRSHRGVPSNLDLLEKTVEDHLAALKEKFSCSAKQRTHSSSG